ncbi:MAG TPA: hypothetical protein VJM50_09960 [Pyrinomonadaceae bacterium]|nr:hypothetical protein [Pyrinomonadaceae bacterium]
MSNPAHDCSAISASDGLTVTITNLPACCGDRKVSIRVDACPRRHCGAEDLGDVLLSARLNAGQR